MEKETSVCLGMGKCPFGVLAQGGNSRTSWTASDLCQAPQAERKRCTLSPCDCLNQSEVDDIEISAVVRLASQRRQRVALNLKFLLLGWLYVYMISFLDVLRKVEVIVEANRHTARTVCETHHRETLRIEAWAWRRLQFC